MRIIGGSCRGHPLKTPTGQDIRPTSDKVRLAVFNALFSRSAVADTKVLDAFCGTGALGLEALSQGADECLFLDASRTSLALAKENANQLGLIDQAQFRFGESQKLGKRDEATAPRTLIFLDPPYRKDLVPQTVAALLAGEWCAEEAILVVETEKEADLSELEEMASMIFDKTYGETRVTFWRLT